MFGVDLGLLAKAVTRLEILDVGSTRLTQQQVVVIVTAVSEGGKLTNLNISWNNLSGVDPGLLAKAVTRLQALIVTYTYLTQQQKVAIITGVNEGSKLTNFKVCGNQLSVVDTGLLAKAVTKLEKLDVSITYLTQQQIMTI